MRLRPYLLFFLPRWTRLAKPNSGASAILFDEFNSCRFQCSAQRSFVCRRYGNLALDNLHPTNGRYADL